jgi:hypothetical protein
MRRREAGLDAGAVTLLQLFKGEREYVSPLFQRQYVWTTKEIEALWDGVDHILEGTDSERFLGALVLEVKSAGMAFRPDSSWIVDGQQRLTTLYITLLLIAKVALQNGAKEFATEILNQYVFNQGAHYKNAPKLQPTLVDFTQFNHLFDGIDEPKAKLPPDFGAPTGALSQAATVIDKAIRKRCFDDKKAFKLEAAINIVSTLLEKLAFVQIVLGAEHDAHQVFDSLNSQGIRLENKDLIRNLVFQKLSDSPEIAQGLYQSQWVPLEESLGDRFDGYFFPFALVHRPNTTKSNLLAVLKEKWKTLQAFEIIQDLRTHVTTYNAVTSDDLSIAKGLTAHPEVNEFVERLNRMNAPSSVFPFLFRVISALHSGALPLEWAVRNLQLIESFLVRRAFAGFEPTGLHAVFKGLWDETQGDPSKFVKTIDDNATVQFPSDEEFRLHVETKPLYGRKLAPYIVLEYERGLLGGDPVPASAWPSLDHVLPQESTAYWRGIFSEEEHRDLVHTWANLLPMSAKANSEKGRKDWDTVKKYFATETVYKTTKRFSENQAVWNAETLRQRGTDLSVWAAARWPKEAIAQKN